MSSIQIPKNGHNSHKKHSNGRSSTSPNGSPFNNNSFNNYNDDSQAEDLWVYFKFNGQTSVERTYIFSATAIQIVRNEISSFLSFSSIEFNYCSIFHAFAIVKCNVRY